MVTNLLFLLAARRAASFDKLAKSAPEKPGVPLAITDISTSGARASFLV